jgi:Zn ribbon nucleic-acid-binding protein
MRRGIDNKFPSGAFTLNEQEIINNGKTEGCPVCKSKDTGKIYLENTKALYFCQQCGVVRVQL